MPETVNSHSKNLSQELNNLHIENTTNQKFAYLKIISMRNKFTDL